MEPIAIYTDAAHVDVGAVRSFSLDMAFGADEQNFELTCSGLSLMGGEYLYIDGTEYGGVVDQYRQATTSDQTAYIGRTWHGILAGKVLKPPSGSDYYIASGEANACIAALVSYVDLGSVFTVSSANSGFTLNYQCDRFCNAYEALLKMLRSAGATLSIVRHDGITELSAVSAALITDEADSDLMEFEVTKAHRVPNHLVCAGEGELQDRIVIDLYADADGNVSQTQSLFGIDEVALYYNYSGADADDLLKDGTKALKEYQTNGGADIGHVGRGTWRVGDMLQVRDNRTGTVVNAIIAKKVIKVERGLLTVDYEVGDDVAAQAASYQTDLGGIVEQPKPIGISRDTANALINELGTATIAINDDMHFIAERSTVDGTYYKRTMATLWDYVKGKADPLYTDGYYGTSTTAAATVNKAVTATGITAVRGGMLLAVAFTYANTVEGLIRLNVNSLGNSIVRVGNTNTSATNPLLWNAGEVLLFIYNGNNNVWQFVGRSSSAFSKRRSHNVLSLITQTDAQAANFTISSATLQVSGYVAMIRVGFSVATALTAGTEYVIGTLDAAIRTALSGIAGIGDRRAFATNLSDGQITIRPEIAFSAGTTTYYFNSTYLLANLYNG